MKGLRQQCQVTHRQTRDSLLRRIAAGKPPAIIKTWPQPDNCPLPYLGIQGTISGFPTPTEQDTLQPQEYRGEGLSEEEIDYPVNTPTTQTHTTLDDPNVEFQDESQDEEIGEIEEPPEEYHIPEVYLGEAPNPPTLPSHTQGGVEEPPEEDTVPEQHTGEAPNTPTLPSHTQSRQQTTQSTQEETHTPDNMCPACGTFVFAGGAHCLNPHCIYWMPPGRAGEGFQITDDYPPPGEVEPRAPSPNT